jgi:hypothetical protein
LSERRKERSSTALLASAWLSACGPAAHKGKHTQ